MGPHLSEIRDLRTVLDRIERDFSTVSSVIALGEPVLVLQANEVSAWSVAEQVDHIVKVNHSIFAHLLTRTPAPGKTISWAGLFVLATRWIPRGKASSPKRLRGETASAGELTAALESCHATFRRLAADPDPLLDPTPILPHKLFGALTAVEALRFVPIHTRHHLKIVEDIQGKRR